MKILVGLFVVIFTLPSVSQTKVWETSLKSSNDIRHLTISQSGKIISVISGGNTYFSVNGRFNAYINANLQLYRTDSSLPLRELIISAYSNPVISLNEDSIYCIGNENLYSIPITDNKIYSRSIKNVKGISLYYAGSFLSLLPDKDKLVFGYGVQNSTSGPVTSESGYVTAIGTDGTVSNNRYYTGVVQEIDANYSNNRFIASGSIHETDNSKLKKFTKQPTTSLFSLNPVQYNYSISLSEYSFIRLCGDPNYIILNKSLFHVPSKNFVRTLDLGGKDGSFLECSHRYQYYLVAKDSHIIFKSLHNDSNFYSLNCSSKIITSHLTEDGNHLVVITNNNKLTVYNISTINVPETKFIVDFSSDYAEPFVGGQISFGLENSFIPFDNPQFFWNFGDGNTSSNSRPKHTYVKPGIYTVSLTITSPTGVTLSKVKTDYINYISPPIPDDALWSSRFVPNSQITALHFSSKSNVILAGTNDGSLFSINLDGLFGNYIFKNKKIEYIYKYIQLNSNTYKLDSNYLCIRDITVHENDSVIYAIAVPHGTSVLASLLTAKINSSEIRKVEYLRNALTYGDFRGKVPDFLNTSYSDYSGGIASLDLNEDSSSILYSNQGKVSYEFHTNNYPYTISGSDEGGNAGILSFKANYDICIPPKDAFYNRVNPEYKLGAYDGSRQYFYSICSGLPYNPNSYFVISHKDSVCWIQDGSFALISSFPTKGRTLRHSPNRYHSFTNDAIWSFADNKKVDSLPLLSAQTFEPFPNGVHLLVMYPKSDTAAVFNTQTKSFVHYFKANSTISSIAISQDGSKVAIGDINGIVTMWIVPPLPVIKTLGFEAPSSKHPLTKDDTVGFFNTSVPVNSQCSYSWDFGDGTTSQEQYPKHIYSRPGKYTVTLHSLCPSVTGDSTSETIIKENYIVISDAVNVNEENHFISNSYLSVTPNPVVGEGIISVHLPQSQRYTISIINILGQEVSTFEHQEGTSVKYVLPFLQNGMYFCILQYGLGQIHTRTFIVKD